MYHNHTYEVPKRKIVFESMYLNVSEWHNVPKQLNEIVFPKKEVALKKKLQETI